MSDEIMQMGLLLCELSDRQFDPAAKALVRRWGEPVRSAEVQEVLDACVNGALCGSFEIRALEIVLNVCRAREFRAELESCRKPE